MDCKPFHRKMGDWFRNALSCCDEQDEDEGEEEEDEDEDEEAEQQKVMKVIKVMVMMRRSSTHQHCTSPQRSLCLAGRSRLPDRGSGDTLSLQGDVRILEGDGGGFGDARRPGMRWRVSTLRQPRSPPPPISSP